MLLTFFFLSFSLFAQTTSEWINSQWENLPRQTRATKPSARIEISEADRMGIDINATPKARNEYLQKSYGDLALDFSECLNVPMGSWYHFAFFANRTSGEFISGKRFDEMDWLQRELLRIMGWHRVIPNEEEMIKLFAYVNFTIGVEMVPHGRAFLKTFCSYGPKPTFDTFEKLIEKNDLAREELIEGYRWYYNSLFENDPLLKLEKVALGTSYLMMGEQRRAQVNVDALFRLGDDSRGPVEFFYRWTAAATTGLELSGGVVIPFNRELTDTYAGDLKVTLAPYFKLHADHKLRVLPVNGKFKGTAVFDWGNLDQRLRFLVGVVRAHSERLELMDIR